MNKKYTLSVRGKSPRGRGKTRVVSSGGGTVYVSGGIGASSGSSQPAVADTPGSATTPPASYDTWRLVADPSAVKIAKGRSTPTIKCSVERITRERTIRYTTPESLESEAVEVWMQIDGGLWQRYIIGETMGIATQSACRITTRSRRALITQGRNVDTSGVDNLVAFELRDRVTARVYAAVSVPVVRDGAMGSTGPMVYPAGTWKASTTYRSDNGACPAVQYKGVFYVLSPGEVATGVNPQQDYAANGSAAQWQPMDSMQYVFADVLMANFAKLGGAVFYGDYMFSQDGTIDGVPVSGNDSEGVAYYTRFRDGVSDGTFIPNICVNFRSGYLSAAVGVFSGNIHTLFVDAANSDAVTNTAGVYVVRAQHKLLSTFNGAVFELPNDASMIGSRVMICDPRITAGLALHPMVIKPESGEVIIGMSPDSPTTTSGVRQVQMYAGVCELLAVPKYDASNVLDPDGCQWLVLTISARYTNSSDTDYVSGSTLPVLPGGMFTTDPNLPINPIL